MAHEQVYEGTFKEIAVRYSNELADRRVRVMVVEADEASTAVRSF